MSLPGGGLTSSCAYPDFAQTCWSSSTPQSCVYTHTSIHGSHTRPGQCDRPCFVPPVIFTTQLIPLHLGAVGALFICLRQCVRHPGQRLGCHCWRCSSLLSCVRISPSQMARSSRPALRFSIRRNRARPWAVVRLTPNPPLSHPCHARQLTRHRHDRDCSGRHSKRDPPA